MKTETMTIHEALATLKVLDNRITSSILQSDFVNISVHSSGKTAHGTIGDFVVSAESSYQGIVDMIDRRKALRNAVSMSNAKTIVNIGGVEYTVSEAIEMRKTGVEMKKHLLTALTKDYEAAMAECTRRNLELQTKADAYIASIFGSKERIASTEAEAARKAYVESNTVDMVSIKDVQARMNKLAEEIDSFEAEVDSRLSISNATTVITIQY